MEIQNLNRLNDALFKDVFGKDANITLSFVNSVLSYEGTPTFQSIDFINRELSPMEEDGKESRLDILGLEAKTGSKVNLEVQVIKQKYYGKRSLYYWARLYNDLKRGEHYDKLSRTVTINILDFILFEDESEKSNWHSSFGVYDKKTGKKLTDDLEMYFIELPKWRIQKDIKDMNTFERWTSYFDKKTSKNELEEITMAEPMVKEAVKRENLFTQDEIQRHAYLLKEMFARDRKAQMDYAIETGMEKGREQGRTEGEERMAKLFTYMSNEGKAGEFAKVIENKDLREQLFLKYNIK